MNLQICGQITIFDYQKSLIVGSKADPLCSHYDCLYDQSGRCRNQRKCPEGMSYIKYTGSSVRQCLEATTEIFQDGYIHCPILNYLGCEKCMERFGDGSDFKYDVSQNYERLPR